MKETFELLELAVRRTRLRVSDLVGQKTLTVLEILGDEICRLAMEDSGGLQVDE